MKISILGTEYDFDESTAKEDSRLSENDGYHDGYAKIIRVEKDYNENHPFSIQDWDEFKKSIKRHEIVHAFLFESGARKECENEQLVDWIATQFPKMLKAFQETDCI